MRFAGAYSGAYVVDVSGDRPRVIFRWREQTPRILASNTKLFTTTAALARFGVEGTLGTEVLGNGELDTEGVYRGSLYLRGGGDPTFGSRRFTKRSYGGGATVQDLAELLEDTGIQRVTGRVYGDESAFDSLRGGPDSGYGVSPWVGPLSALSYNRGLFTEGGRGFQAQPAGVRRRAARRGTRGAGIRGAAEAPRGRDARRGARAGERRLAADGAADPAHQQAVGQLLRRDAPEGPGAPGRRGRHHGGRRAGRGRRTPAGWAPCHARGRLRPVARQPRLALRASSGSSPRCTGSDDFDPFVDSLPIAGQDGTLFDRMRRGPAQLRCRGKTGTLSNVSALSGYCEARRRQLRLLDPDERRVSHRRAPAPGPDASGDREVRLGRFRELVDLGEPVRHLGHVEHVVRRGLGAHLGASMRQRPAQWKNGIWR